MAEERKDVEQEQKKSVGNIGLPFGLCEKLNISLPDNATPRDAWEALKMFLPLLLKVMVAKSRPPHTGRK